jgi:hypothetical protein
MKFTENASCLTIDPSWRAFQEIPFDLNLRADPSLIPLSGPINLSSTVNLREASAPELKVRLANAREPLSNALQPANSAAECISSSRLLTQSVILLPSSSSSWSKVPLLGAFAIALLYLLIALYVLRKSLAQSFGAPQWSFSTSFATNFTVGAGLLTPLLGANAITDELHYMTKLDYALLAILFAALLLLAPAIYWFFSRPRPGASEEDQASSAPEGSVGLFLATSALMIAAVLGQLITVGLAAAEIGFRGDIG